MEKDDAFAQTPGVLAAEWLRTKRDKIKPKYEHRSVSALSQVDPALSTNTRRVLAWACSCGSRVGDTSLFPKSTQSITLQSHGVHRKPPSLVGAVGFLPHLHPTVGTTGTSYPTHPQAPSPSRDIKSAHARVHRQSGCCGLVILSWSMVDPVAKSLSHGVISAAPLMPCEGQPRTETRQSERIK